MKIKSLIALIILGCTNSVAQDTAKSGILKFSGYLETYFCYDMGQPQNHERPNFFYSFNRHNEVNLNLGFLKASYNADKVRGNLALMAGTYAQYNLASEQGLLKNIFEANAGFKIS
ncbi:MAG: outer membrane beta-barrel protein, partial [Bacteroidia bacterium]